MGRLVKESVVGQLTLFTSVTEIPLGPRAFVPSIQFDNPGVLVALGSWDLDFPADADIGGVVELNRFFAPFPTVYRLKWNRLARG